MRLHPYFDYFQLSAVESRVDTSSDTFYNRGYGTPSADCRIEERAGVLGKLPLTAGGFADDFEYSGHAPLCDPPSGGVYRVVGRNLSLSFFFFFPPLFIYLFIYLYRVSPRWGEALGRNKMSFFQEKIFLTKKNIFRPGANALGILPCFRIFCFLYLCGSPPVNRLGPRSAVAVVVSVVMFVCSTQVRRETLGLIGVCFSKVWLLFYSCGLPLNGSASPITTKIGGNIQAAQISPHYVAVEPCYVAPWPDCELRATSHEVNHGVKRKKKI